MHPAASIIFFTTASGAGYGLLALLGLCAAFGFLPAERWIGFTGLVLSLGMITAGLLASTFHLGHPERAWRAFSQWKSSWLSREGVMAVITYVPAGILFVGWVFLESSGALFAVAGILAASCALVTIYCTAMIYASLKPIRQWNSPLVAPNYLLLGLLTGTIFLNMVAYIFRAENSGFLWLMLVLAIAAWIAKILYWRAANEPGGPDTASATGLTGKGPVRTLELPHTNPNYLQKEMVFRVARDHAVRLRFLVQAMAFGIPLVVALILLSSDSNSLGLLLSIFATMFAAIGVLFERWLFFAEAEHTVGLYYN